LRLDLGGGAADQPSGSSGASLGFRPSVERLAANPLNAAQSPEIMGAEIIAMTARFCWRRPDGVRALPAMLPVLHVDAGRIHRLTGGSDPAMS
jgi:hypothetical protein